MIPGRTSFSLVDDRPNFGKTQIRCTDTVCCKGLKIRIHDSKDQDTIFTISRGLYKEDGKLKIDVTFREGSNAWKKTLILEKYSVVRYETNKSWELTNWLERA